jgi:hypothetical protein
MTETLTQAALQAAGILAGALGYHVTKNTTIKQKLTPKFLAPLTCADSVTLANLPDGKDAYLAYVTDWPEVTPEKVRARFPHARIVTVTTDPRYIAEILDVEKGAATTAEIQAWYRMVKLHGIPIPGGYASLANMPGVIEELKIAAGGKRSGYKLIVADWDGSAVIPRGYNGKQYQNTPAYDLSVLGRRAFS